MRPPYKYLFMLFKLSFIFPISKGREDSNFKKIAKQILMVFNVYLTCLFILAMLFTSAPFISNTIIYIVMIVYRWILCIRFHRFRSIERSLCVKDTEGNKFINRLISIWIAVSNITIISLIIYNFTNEASVSKKFVFLSHEIKQRYAVIINSFEFLHKVLHLAVPTNLLSIFYVTVCIEMRSEILHFTKKIRNAPNLEPLIQSYIKMASAVETIDNSLSFLMFCSTIYGSASMYYTTTILLLRRQFVETMSFYILIVVLFLVTIVHFIAMCVSASLVNEASHRVGEKVKALVPDSMASAIQIQRFMSLTDKDLCLTVWKIVPIRRNFIISTLGCVFTYIILFDGVTTTAYSGNCTTN